MNRIQCMLLLISAIAPANAALIVGAPPDPGTGNGYPFGSANFIGVYQQVFDASAFSGPEEIVGVAFFRTQYLSSGTFTGQTYRISLSTTSASVNGLDLSDLNANIGADNALFSERTLVGAAPVGELLFSGTPFYYDPSMGNLLLTIDILGAASYTGNDLFFDARNGTASGAFSRAMFLPSGASLCCGNDDHGLTTRFDFASDAVPEPSTFVLGALPLVAIAWRRMRYHR